MNLLERLQAEFGDAVELCAATAADAVDEVLPAVVAAPRDEAAAHALTAWCGREHVAFVPRGGGTKIGLGARPERCDLIVSTERLDAIIDHDEGNATVTAGAGIALAALDAAVGASRQFVPLDFEVGQAAGATLGGVVAASHAGPARLKYGAPRDLVTGLHAALSDGHLVKAGSKVVKNVSGYDLNKIFIGSLGTLGLITQVTVRLRPRDAASQTWQSRFPTWDDAMALAWEIVNGPFEPTALRVTVDAAGVAVLARFDGVESSVQAQLDRLGPVAPAPPASDQASAAFVLRAALPLQSAPAWARRAQDDGATVTWDAGLGLVRAAFETAPDVAALRAAAEAAAGFLIVERAPASLKTSAFVWGAPRADFALLRRLKESYDPARVCAPGRFVGGL